MPDSQFQIRNAVRADAKHIARIVSDTKILDVNSCYAYLVLCDHFSQTCFVATIDDQPVGFVTSFIPPERPNALFVWQIGVDPKYWKNGIGIKLLKTLNDCEACTEINLIETTISPSNVASRALFTRLARLLNTEMRTSVGYTTKDFESGEHEDEESVHIDRRPHDVK